MTAMDDGPVTGRDLDDAACAALAAHDAGRPCHTGCAGTADCPQLAWARRHHGLGGPRRPSWTCTVCPAGTPWPCPPARAALVDAYAGDRLRMVVELATMMQTALAETGEDGGVLYERFVLWTRMRGRQPGGSRPADGEPPMLGRATPPSPPWWHGRRI
ncbi:hypothetical protein [Solwaraspora sp. WMMA2101]|uniref:hypothetical protein n=1 Tax=Solwaraspora sp. WMMA2101 TaxID=3404124 RepID=UPI003B966822